MPFFLCVCVCLQVKEVDVPGGEVQVFFMTQQGQQYFWSTKPDSSWETLDYFLSNSRTISIHLNVELSTQRKPIFEIEQGGGKGYQC